jgi:hypothetical protein
VVGGVCCHHRGHVRDLGVVDQMVDFLFLREGVVFA